MNVLKGDELMKITNVKKDEKGVIQQYKLENGKVIDQAQAVQMVSSGKIEGCNVGATRNGEKTIRSNPDGDPSNNLDNLPTF